MIRLCKYYDNNVNLTYYFILGESDVMGSIGVVYLEWVITRKYYNDLYHLNRSIDFEVLKTYDYEEEFLEDYPEYQIWVIIDYVRIGGNNIKIYHVIRISGLIQVIILKNVMLKSQEPEVKIAHSDGTIMYGKMKISLVFIQNMEIFTD